jgi:hypothetical protein
MQHLANLIDQLERERGVRFDVEGPCLVVLGMNRLSPEEFVMVSRCREDLRLEVLRRRGISESCGPQYVRSFDGMKPADAVRLAERFLTAT